MKILIELGMTGDGAQRAAAEIEKLKTSTTGAASSAGKLKEETEALTSTGAGLATSTKLMDTAAKSYNITSEAQYLLVQKAHKAISDKIAVTKAAGGSVTELEKTEQKLSEALSTQSAIRVAEQMETKAVAAAQQKQAATGAEAAAAEMAQSEAAFAATVAKKAETVAHTQNTIAMREEMVIMRELSSGNMSRTPGSLSLLFANMGIGAAGIGAIGAAMPAYFALEAYFNWQKKVEAKYRDMIEGANKYNEAIREIVRTTKSPDEMFVAMAKATAEAQQFGHGLAYDLERDALFAGNTKDALMASAEYMRRMRDNAMETKTDIEDLLQALGIITAKQATEFKIRQDEQKQLNALQDKQNDAQIAYDTKKMEWAKAYADFRRDSGGKTYEELKKESEQYREQATQQEKIISGHAARVLGIKSEMQKDVMGVGPERIAWRDELRQMVEEIQSGKLGQQGVAALSSKIEARYQGEPFFKQLIGDEGINAFRMIVSNAQNLFREQSLYESSKLQIQGLENSAAASEKLASEILPAEKTLRDLTDEVNKLSSKLTEATTANGAQAQATIRQQAEIKLAKQEVTAAKQTPQQIIEGAVKAVVGENLLSQRFQLPAETLYQIEKRGQAAESKMAEAARRRREAPYGPQIEITELDQHQAQAYEALKGFQEQIRLYSSLLTALKENGTAQTQFLEQSIGNARDTTIAFQRANAQIATVWQAIRIAGLVQSEVMTFGIK